LKKNLRLGTRDSSVVAESGLFFFFFLCWSIARGLELELKVDFVGKDDKLGDRVNSTRLCLRKVGSEIGRCEK
jgi:hypothetical protein